MKNLLTIVALTATLSGSAVYAAQSESLGTVNITVVDENGALVPDAPVYYVEGLDRGDAMTNWSSRLYSRFSDLWLVNGSPMGAHRFRRGC